MVMAVTSNYGTIGYAHPRVELIAALEVENAGPISILTNGGCARQQSSVYLSGARRSGRKVTSRLMPGQFLSPNTSSIDTLPSVREERVMSRFKWSIPWQMMAPF